MISESNIIMERWANTSSCPSIAINHIPRFKAWSVQYCLRTTNIHWSHSIKVGHSLDFGLPSVAILQWLCIQQSKILFTSFENSYATLAVPPIFETKLFSPQQGTIYWLLLLGLIPNEKIIIMICNPVYKSSLLGLQWMSLALEQCYDICIYFCYSNIVLQISHSIIYFSIKYDFMRIHYVIITLHCSKKRWYRGPHN